MQLSSLRLVTVASLYCLVGLFACSDDAPPAPTCIAVDRSCTPAYEPTFDNLFQMTFSRSCALAGTSCHAAAGHQAGLVLDDADTAYRLLLEHGRAVASKPECSLLARRILSTDRTFMMPPGLPLAPGEQCAIIQWMAHGASR
jgi:hypothetical protein